MSLALHDTIGPRATRLSVLVTAPEAEEISARAEAAGLSVSAYLRAQALGAIPSADQEDALKIFDRVIDDISTRIDQANASLEATLTRLSTPA